MKKVIIGLLIVFNCLAFNNYVYSQTNKTDISEEFENILSEYEDSPVNQIRIIGVGDKEDIKGVAATRCVVTTMTDGDLTDLIAIYYSFNEKVILYDNKIIKGDDFIVLTTESFDFKGRKLTVPVYVRKSELLSVLATMID